MERITIRLEMVRQGIKGVEISKTTGIPATTFSAIVSGRINPTQREKVLIAGALNKPVGDLFGE